MIRASKVFKGDQGDQGIQGLKGDQGDQGIQGPKGDQGAKGDTGETGPSGVNGTNGISGIPGQDGATGPQGLKGDQGVKGDKGERGERGFKGERGDIGPASKDGKDYVTGSSGDTHKLKMIYNNKITNKTIDPITSFSRKNGDKLCLAHSLINNMDVKFKTVLNENKMNIALDDKYNLIFARKSNELYDDMNNNKPGMGEGGLIAAFENNIKLKESDIVLLCS